MYGKKRILIIERAEDSQKVLKLSLEMVGGWEVIGAESEREARDLLKTDRFDAIILNIVNGDRTTILKTASSDKIGRSIPIIAIVPNARSQQSWDLKKLGVVLVVSQMLNPIILVDRIAKKFNWGIVKTSKD